jgi:hypothetical protein
MKYLFYGAVAGAVAGVLKLWAMGMVIAEYRRILK